METSNLWKLLKNDKKDVWGQALSNKGEQLASSNDKGAEATDTIGFISFKQVPSCKNVTYASFVCDFCPLKKEKW